MAEKSSIGLIEIVLRIICAAFCFGVLIASAVTLSTINDINIFDDDLIESEIKDDRDRYRAVAGWLLFVGIAGIVQQVIFMTVRGLYYGEVIKSQFAIFGVVSIIFIVLLGLALIAGGIASAINAADVKDEYIDPAQIICDSSNINNVKEQCDNFDQLRDSQAAAAGLSFIGAVVCGVISVMICVEIAARKDN